MGYDLDEANFMKAYYDIDTNHDGQIEIDEFRRWTLNG
jgi:hypothetical protein